jgi:hypothetical protein
VPYHRYRVTLPNVAIRVDNGLGQITYAESMLIDAVVPGDATALALSYSGVIGSVAGSTTVQIA